MGSMIKEYLDSLFFWPSSLKKITVKRKEGSVKCANSHQKLALEHITGINLTIHPDLKGGLSCV